MGAFHSIIGFLPIIAVSFSLGILFLHQYQRMLFRHYMQERRRLMQQIQQIQQIQQMQQMMRVTRRYMEEREE